jgi:hypothetical protein
MRKHLIATALALLALPTSAIAATKTYDVERIFLRITGEFFGEGWVFMEDVKGLQSQIGIVLVDQEGIIDFNCHGFAPFTQPPRDFNVVNVGPFAQQASGSLPSAFAPFLRCGLQTPITSLEVSCPFGGIPAPQSLDHGTVNHAGTYKGENGVASSYKITGHRDRAGLCDVIINGGAFEAFGTLNRFSQAHTGDTRFVDFYRDPTGWLNLRDVTFPF